MVSGCGRALPGRRGEPPSWTARDFMIHLDQTRTVMSELDDIGGGAASAGRISWPRRRIGGCRDDRHHDQRAAGPSHCDGRGPWSVRRRSVPFANAVLSGHSGPAGWLLPLVGFSRLRGGTSQSIGTGYKSFVRAPHLVAIEASRHVVGNIVSDEPPEQVPQALVLHHLVVPVRSDWHYIDPGPSPVKTQRYRSGLS
jgi:hypothetical protein